VPFYDDGMGTLSLKHRHVVPELMDAPDLDPQQHAKALAGLRRLNRAASAAAPIAGAILKIASRHSLEQLTILDVACGGGDVSVAVAQRLRLARVTAHLTLTDRSPVALERASALATASGCTVRALPGSAPDKLPDEEYDIVMNTLFLHHLSREEVVATLRQMSRRARSGIVVADLRRSLPGYLLACVMCRVLSRSPVVHFDGPASVRAAWSMGEMRDMGAEVGLEVRPCWPFRMLMTAGRK
jgi:2-polyprenyl-3-methyl-5-hydroxy-6-metoxy-1,4-benzoquinol methylase